MPLPPAAVAVFKKNAGGASCAPRLYHVSVSNRNFRNLLLRPFLASEPLNMDGSARKQNTPKNMIYCNLQRAKQKTLDTLGYEALQ